MMAFDVYVCENPDEMKVSTGSFFRIMREKESGKAVTPFATTESIFAAKIFR